MGERYGTRHHLLRTDICASTWTAQLFDTKGICDAHLADPITLIKTQTSSPAGSGETAVLTCPDSKSAIAGNARIACSA